MIVHEDLEQGSPEWFAVRMGIPTASEFSRVITPKGAPSKSADKVVAEKVAEALMGEPIHGASSSFMQRGNDLEQEARLWYAWDRDVEIKQVGFVTLDDRSAGCSPDGLVGSDGMVEIKCLSAVNHVLAALGGSTNEYTAQCQGQLWICERQWVDRVFYSPKLEPVVVRAERDEKYIELLASAVRNVSTAIADGRARLGLAPAPTLT